MCELRREILTCDGGLDVQKVLLRAQDGRSLTDEAQGDALVHTALFGQMSLEDIDFGLSFAVKHLFHGQPVAGGERDSCRKKKKIKKERKTLNHGRASLRTEALILSTKGHFIAI